jgi:hypothetical protein
VTITRRNYGRGHSYAIDGVKAEGVTTLLGRALPKRALIEWAGKTTASYAVDRWDELAELKPSVRLDRLNRARYEERDAAARRGTEVHTLAQRAVAGEDLDAICPEELRGHVESYIEFLDAFDVSPVLIETVIANRKEFYCGTLDLVADMGGERWLIDVKTGRSGIFGETALQCCAYARAEVYIDDAGDEYAMADLGITRTGAVHVRADGWDLYPLRYDDDLWLVWRHLLWVVRHGDEDAQREWVGEVLSPPPPAAVAS